MKKFIISLILSISSISINAQSFELHQSYNDDNSSWGSTRFISEYFWVNEPESINIFSWNSFSQNGISGLLYFEYLLYNNLFVHTEVRAQFGNFEYSTITPEIGFAYLLPLGVGGPSVYLTPKYVYNDIYLSKHDFQVSINSSYENDYVYYEGYFDTNWIKGVSFFTEQKAYYKITQNFQVGLAIVANGMKIYNSDINNSHIHPYFTIRIGLY